MENTIIDIKQNGTGYTIKIEKGHFLIAHVLNELAIPEVTRNVIIGTVYANYLSNFMPELHAMLTMGLASSNLHEFGLRSIADIITNSEARRKISGCIACRLGNSFINEVSLGAFFTDENNFYKKLKDSGNLEDFIKLYLNGNRIKEIATMIMVTDMSINPITKMALAVKKFITQDCEVIHDKMEKAKEATCTDTIPNALQKLFDVYGNHFERFQETIKAPFPQ